MDAVLQPTGMTPQEYLDWESTQQEKHEYIGGQVYAMTGARLNHKVETSRPHAELFSRNAEGLWVLHPLGLGDSIRVQEPRAFDWPVAALFEGVPFDPPAGASLVVR